MSCVTGNLWILIISNVCFSRAARFHFNHVKSTRPFFISISIFDSNLVSETPLFSQSKLRKHMLPNHAVQNCPLCANARSVENGVKSSLNSSLACPSIHPWVKAVPHIFWVDSRPRMKMSWRMGDENVTCLCLVNYACSIHLTSLCIVLLSLIK